MWAGAALAADPPAENKAAANKRPPQATSEEQRQQEALAHCQRLVDEAEQFEASGRTAEAISAWQKAIAVARPIVGDASDPIAKMQERISRLHESRGEWTPALRARSEVLAIRGKQYGDKDWRVTDARLALRELEIRSRLTAEQRRELLQTGQANSRAADLYRKGEFRQAIRFSEQVADIDRRILGGTHRYIATDLDNLAGLYRAMGDNAKAAQLLQEALAIRKKVQGEEHPDTASSLNQLGELSYLMGDYAKAEPLFQAGACRPK